MQQASITGLRDCSAIQARQAGDSRAPKEGLLDRPCALPGHSQGRRSPPKQAYREGRRSIDNYPMEQREACGFSQVDHRAYGLSETGAAGHSFRDLPHHQNNLLLSGNEAYCEGNQKAVALRPTQALPSS
jgi:hypothetical protein